MTKPAVDWWRGAVMYQIYPRSFRDSDGDGIGDLKGIADKLAYVAGLGVDGVWLSPFFKSPMRDFGYDVSDYREVDPMFGSLADFDALLAKARALGLKVIIDQVYAHTSSDHPWFQESRMDRTNARADWYVWADPKPDGAPPNNWQAWFGGAAWTWEPRRRQYYLHNFLPTQPQLNFRNPAVQAAILETARFWLDRGVDGFRLDVANYYVHDALLRDNPPSGDPEPALPRDMQLHAFNSNQPETLDFVVRLRELMDGYGPRMTVGELAPGSYDLMALYTSGLRGLHTAYAFDFLKAWPGPKRFVETISEWAEGPEDGWPSWAFANHDVRRVATRWGEAVGATPMQAAPLFLALLLSLRGTVFLYQGEELGLPEGEVPFEKLRDPWGVAGWPATKGRDGCRTPMPWDGSAGAGFSSGEPWLPVDAAQRELSVAAQEADVGSVLQLTRRLIAIRQASAALRGGALSAASATEAGLIHIARKAGEEEVLCFFNIDAHGCRLAIGDGLSSLWAHKASIDGGVIRLEPFGAIWLKA